MLLILIFIVFIAFHIAVGIWHARRITTVNEFFITSRSLLLGETTASLVVTQLGGNMILDTSSKGFEHGIYGLFYPLGITLGLVLLTTTIAQSWRSHSIKTTAELFRARYKSVRLQKLAACVSVISLMGILIAQVIALKFAICPYLSFSHYCLFMGTLLCVILYTMLGGLATVITTDLAQAFIIYGFFGLFFITLLIVEPYSFSEIIASVTENPLIPTEVNIADIVSVFILPGLYILISQDVIQFIIKAKTIAIAKAATSISGLLLIGFAFIPFLCGLIAKKALPGLDESTHVIIALMDTMVPQWMVGLGLCALCAAIISTIDSILVAISAYIINDIAPEYAHSLTSTRCIIAVTGMVSLIAAYYSETQALLLTLHSYELALSVLFIPIMACIYFTDWPDATHRAWASCIIGGTSYVASIFLLPPSIPRILLTFSLSALPFLMPSHRHTQRST